ncbi:DUF421 domain-containing protein [Kytococcus sp. Marseille-QA3725]
MLPLDGTHELWFQIGISHWGAVGVVISTTVLYLVYTVVMQVLGPRLMSAPSVLSFTLVALFGAIAARAMLGNSPTLLGALIAIGTLLLLEAFLGRVQQGVGQLLHLHGPQPAVVMVNGHVIHPHLRQRRLNRSHLLAMLRRAGIQRVEDVQLVILENRGSLTVVRKGEKIDRDLIAGVAGRRLVPAALVAGPPRPQGRRPVPTWPGPRARRLPWRRR